MLSESLSTSKTQLHQHVGRSLGTLSTVKDVPATDGVSPAHQSQCRLGVETAPENGRQVPKPIRRLEAENPQLTQGISERKTV